MNRRIRGAVLCLAMIGLAIGITACMSWLATDPVPTLLVGPVSITGDRGEILLSVKNMPDGGLASMAVNLGGIGYDSGKISNVSVEALLGFSILAEQFDADDGGFLIAHSCAGIHDGGVVKLKFKVTGTPTLADFTITEADISMGDDNNNAIAFQFKDEFAYYAK